MSTTASSWGQVLEALRGALTMTLSSFFPDRWLNMTPLQMLGHVFAYLNWNPWNVAALIALSVMAHVWYFWESVVSWSKTLAKLGLFYTGLVVAINLVSWAIDRWQVNNDPTIALILVALIGVWVLCFYIIPRIASRAEKKD